METNSLHNLLFQRKNDLKNPRHDRQHLKEEMFKGPYLSSVALHLALSLVPLQVGLLQGEATHPAAQREEEDRERGGGRAEAPQCLEVT